VIIFFRNLVKEKILRFPLVCQALKRSEAKISSRFCALLFFHMTDAKDFQNVFIFEAVKSNAAEFGNFMVRGAA
jgi:hypothetical protein